MDIPTFPHLSRRRFVTGMAAGAALYGLGGVLTQRSFAQAPALGVSQQVLRGKQFDLSIAAQTFNFTGKDRIATVVNGSLPGPILRWKEGERVTLRVRNHLAHDSSIHWHGLILPSNMDGVPGLSFAGIKPGESYEYQFDVKQNGTYWYHSHSGFQEQTGLYGAIIIDPADSDPVAYDREHVVLLSDWSDQAPGEIYANLKKLSHYYNFQERTAGELWREIRDKGVAATWRERSMWNQMRMNQRDLADVTGYTYTYLMNGVTPDSGWTGLFKPGEKVRLRFINGAAMTIFDIRIPGLKMTVVAADGQNIEPVTVDQFRIGTAETYDVVVDPQADMAYCVFAQTIDRSGFARGTLTPDLALTADVPAMDYRPDLSHRDMGMTHDMSTTSGADHEAHADTSASTAMSSEMDHSMHSAADHAAMDHSMHAGMQHQMMPGKPAPAGFGSTMAVIHAASEDGPQTDMQSSSPMNGLTDPGVGLRDHGTRYGRRVLSYGDIRNLTPTLDRRDPTREIQIHLTGNMSRYMWSMDGIKHADADPIRLQFGERVRVTLVNDTMMTHPIHLHGMWSELETNEPKFIPRKHTVLVQPGSKISYLVTADALGRWAYHCHLLYHMPGMMREVTVEKGGRS